MSELMEAALAVRASAHAPYSGFAVGAALRDEAGRVHVGCNVENASYPHGLCAEAGAISAMVAAGGRRIVEIAVAGPDGMPCPPCGGCRQRIREFAGEDTPVLLRGETGGTVRHRFGDLFPVSFGPENLSG